MVKSTGILKCSVEGCDRKHHGKGFCGKHLHQINRHGHITPELERVRYSKDAVCKVEGCDNKIKARGYCDKHSLQFYRHGEVQLRTEKDRNEIIIHDDYAEIVLYNKKCEPVATTLIDVEDVEKVKMYKWTSVKSKTTTYVKNDQVGKLHRFIMNAPPDMEVDHIFNNGLDNRKSQLRLCNRFQNCQNTRIRSDNSSGVKGVSFYKRIGKWVPEIQVNGQKIKLGNFDNKEDAIRTRKVAEQFYFGEFSNKEAV